MNRQKWDLFLHRVADRVFVLRVRLNRVRFPGRAILGRINPLRFEWRSLLNPSKVAHLARRHSRALAALALVAIIVSGGFRAVTTARAVPPKPEPIKPVNVYYFDLGDGKLFTAPSDSPVPMKAPSGGLGPMDTLGGVRAHLFACTSCADPKDRFIGYLETSDPNAPAPAPGAKPALAGMGNAGRYIASPEPEYTWYPATSPNGLAVSHLARARCTGDSPPKYCMP